MIWKSAPSLEQLNAMSHDTLLAHLGITFTAIGEDYLCATMPVDRRTRQPFGLLHGGASVVLAESLGSTAASLVVGPDSPCVGLDINANHVRGVRDGIVTGRASPKHLGRSTHVWQIDIADGRERLVCTSRLTMAVLGAVATS
ncbi:MAG: hotdog fold thioesterase [Pseudomonadota bacterium]